MPGPQLENLLRQLGDLDAFERAAGLMASPASAPDRRQRFRALILRRIVPLGAAAALLALFSRPGAPPADPEGHWELGSAQLASMTHEPFVRLSGPQRFDSFEACARRDGYAMVLLRAWSEECNCMTWRVHEDDDGRRILAFQTGETVRFSIDVTANPAAEQLFVVALADRPAELPGDAEAAAQLLSCLDTSAPASFPSEASLSYDGALAACLPTGVQLVQRSFRVD